MSWRHRNVVLNLSPTVLSLNDFGAERIKDSNYLGAVKFPWKIKKSILGF